MDEASAGVVSSLLSTARDVRGLVADHVELAVLEAQRATGGLVRMLVVTIVAAILLVGAWVAGVVGAALWATTAGISAPTALLGAAAANIAVAAALLFWLRRQMPELLFAATLRQLRNTLGDGDIEENP